jgi:hypothetical protein
MVTRIARYAFAALLSVAVLVAFAESPYVGIGGKLRPTVVPLTIVVDPAATTGGSTVQATLTVNAVVEEQDQVVQLETDHPEVFSNFPQNVVVAVGHDSVTFDLTTVPVSGSVQTTLVASCNGGQTSGTLTVNP